METCARQEGPRRRRSSGEGSAASLRAGQTGLMLGQLSTPTLLMVPRGSPCSSWCPHASCGCPATALGPGLSNRGALGSKRLQDASSGTSHKEHGGGERRGGAGSRVSCRSCTHVPQPSRCAYLHPTMSPQRPPCLSSWGLLQPSKEGATWGSSLLPALGQGGMFQLNTSAADEGG